MKQVCKVLCLILAVCTLVLTGCQSKEETLQCEDYLRIHIRANSNDAEDQRVKYLVRDAVVEYLIPVVSGVSSKEELESVLTTNMRSIQSVADKVLEQNGKTYKSKGKVCNEYFPTRVYGDTVLESNYYDALILNLGTGTGDNWWCVVYPPLCFVNSKQIDTTHIRYKSKIMELIKKIMG